MTFANSELADSNVHDRFVASSSVLDVLDSFYGFGLLLTLAAAGFCSPGTAARCICSWR